MGVREEDSRLEQGRPGGVPVSYKLLGLQKNLQKNLQKICKIAFLEEFSTVLTTQHTNLERSK